MDNEYRISNDATGPLAPFDPSDAEQPAAPSRGRGPVVWATVGGLLLVAAILIALATGLLSFGSAAVPNVIGTTEAFAREQLTEAGFTVGRVTRTYSEEKAGVVLGQSPLANAKANRDGLVDLVVSRGPERIEVPIIIGMTEADAIAALEKVGLLGAALPAQYSADFSPGLILRQTPPPGDMIAQGQTVRFVPAAGAGSAASAAGGKGGTAGTAGAVGGGSGSWRPGGGTTTGGSGSGTGGGGGGGGTGGGSGGGGGGWNGGGGGGTGGGTGGGGTGGGGWNGGGNPNQPRPFLVVPVVTGMAQANAELFLRESGFLVVVEEVYDSSARAGAVYAQSPLPGTHVAISSTVYLTVSKGPGTAEVPNVVGMSGSAAKSALVQAGFKAVAIYALQTGNDKVVSQSPKPGTKIDRGATVTVTVDGRPM